MSFLRYREILWLVFLHHLRKNSNVPFHLRLPKAHVEHPRWKCILAGILLKLGSYGFLRFFIFISIATEYFRHLLLF